MLFKSALVTQASGSVGGITASRNAGGMYFRARALPTNPNTPFQQEVRNAMTQLTGRWGDVLTGAQRDAWKVYGEQTGLLNPLGDQVNVSGISMYTRSNISRIQAGLDIADAAPTVFNIGDFTAPVLSAPSEGSQDFSLSFTTGDAWVDEDGSAMLVYVSRPQNPTINFFKGPYRLAATIPGDGTTAPTSPVAVDVPFAITAGQRLFVKVRVTRADGRLSGDFRDFATVGA